MLASVSGSGTSGHLVLMIQPLLGNLEGCRHVEDLTPVLNRDYPAGGEAPAVPRSIHFVEESGPLDRPHAGSRRERSGSLGHRRCGSPPRALAEHLPAVDPVPASSAVSAKEIELDPFQIEQPDQFLNPHAHAYPSLSAKRAITRVSRPMSLRCAGGRMHSGDVGDDGPLPPCDRRGHGGSRHSTPVVVGARAGRPVVASPAAMPAAWNSPTASRDGAMKQTWVPLPTDASDPSSGCSNPELGKALAVGDGKGELHDPARADCRHHRIVEPARRFEVLVPIDRWCRMLGISLVISLALTLRNRTCGARFYPCRRMRSSPAPRSHGRVGRRSIPASVTLAL